MDHPAIVQDYMRLRQMSISLNDDLATMLTSNEIAAAASALGMLHGKQIDLNTEDESSVLMDFAIHDIVRDGTNAISRLLRDNPPPEGSDKLRLLRSMQQSHYTIVDVQTPIPGVGVRGFDGPKRTPILLVDIGFSRTAIPGMALATRIHSPGEAWWMTTGATLPLNHKALNRMNSGLEDYQRRFGVEPSGGARTALMIRACLASGSSRQIRYAAPDDDEAEQSQAAPSIRAAAKTGRNEPCPCGSGKKYKKCCG